MAIVRVESSVEELTRCMEYLIIAADLLETTNLEADSKERFKRAFDESRGIIDKLRSSVITYNSQVMSTRVNREVIEASPKILQATGSQILGQLMERVPVAVDPILICNPDSESDRAERAEQILDMLVDEKLTGKSFLDFGCGKGDTLAAAIQRGSTKAVGYDIAPVPVGEGIRTSDFNVVREHGPYNVVLLYDVLDHITTEDPVEVFARIKSVLAPDGMIYIRCHPWCSRHGGHLYNQINKAYAHLIYTAEELNKLGYQPEPNRRVIFPLFTYRSIFQQAGYTVIRENNIQEQVDDIFKQGEIADRIKRNWENTNLQGFPDFQLSLSFCDYAIKPN